MAAAHTNHAEAPVESSRFQADLARGEMTLADVLVQLQAVKDRINMQAVRQQVKQVIRFVVLHNHDLLEYRHVDQVVLAAVYGVCKIHQAEVTFKDLVQAYKVLPDKNPQTWLQVPLARPGAFGNIISFYNDVFVPRCKDYLHGMKDATAITVSTPRAAQPPEPPSAPGTGQTGLSGATIQDSPGFRAAKRQRPASKPSDDGSHDSRGSPPARTGGSVPAPPAMSHDAMPPPMSPTRKPSAHVPRSPFAEYPASPFKRPLTSPLRATVGASPMRSPARSGLAVPPKYGQVNLSPARKQSKTPVREPATPRTSFFHAFGSLGGVSPAPHFNSINDKLKSPSPAPAMRKLTTKPIDFERRPRGQSSLANAEDVVSAAEAPTPRTLSAPSALLALAQASDAEATAMQQQQQHAAAAPPASDQVPTQEHQRMQDLAVASVIVADGDAGRNQS